MFTCLLTSWKLFMPLQKVFVEYTNFKKAVSIYTVKIVMEAPKIFLILSCMIYSTENSGSYFWLKLIKSLIILETSKDNHSRTH